MVRRVFVVVGSLFQSLEFCCGGVCFSGQEMDGEMGEVGQTILGFGYRGVVEGEGLFSLEEAGFQEFMQDLFVVVGGDEYVSLEIKVLVR